MSIDFTQPNINSNYLLKKQLELIDKTDYFYNLSNYGAVGDGVADDTDAFDAFLEDCRVNKRKGYVPVPSNYYRITRTLDIAGCHIESTNTLGSTGSSYQMACIIKGDNTFPIMEQKTANNNYNRMCIKNFNLQNGTIGLKLTTSIFSLIENVITFGCPIGFQIGDNSLTGSLWTILRQCNAYYCSNAGLLLEGGGNGNAILCDTCYFRGSGTSAFGVRSNISGGLQGVSNSFINCEIVNDSGMGVELKNGRNMIFENGYLECRGPLLKIFNTTSRPASIAFNNCLFGSLYETGQTNPSTGATNQSGVSAWLWHSSGDCEINVDGGYIIASNSTLQNNLRFVYSDDVDKLTFRMLKDPTISVTGTTGFKLYDTGLPTNKFIVNYSESYTPVWSALSGTPVLGNGILEGKYTLNGKLCHTTIELTFGSTTVDTGTGDWRFSLPFKPSSATENSLGNAYLYDSAGGGNYYIGVVRKVSISATEEGAFILLNNNGAAVKAGTPFNWKALDKLELTITYEL